MIDFIIDSSFYTTNEQQQQQQQLTIPISALSKLLAPYINKSFKIESSHLSSSSSSSSSTSSTCLKTRSSLYSLERPCFLKHSEEDMTDDSSTISSAESTIYVSTNSPNSSCTSISTKTTLIGSFENLSNIRGNNNNNNNFDNYEASDIKKIATLIHSLSKHFVTVLNNDEDDDITSNPHYNNILVTSDCNKLQKQQQQSKKVLEKNTTTPKRRNHSFRFKKNHNNNNNIDSIEDNKSKTFGRCRSSNHNVTSTSNSSNVDFFGDVSNTTLVVHPSSSNNNPQPLTSNATITRPYSLKNNFNNATTTTTTSFQQHQPHASSPCFRNLLIDHKSATNKKKYALNNTTIENFSLVDIIEAQFLAQSHPSTLMPVIEKLAKSMSKSLYSNNSPTMLPSLLTSLPTGNESGVYLSVDVGGSTLRIALVQLFGKKAKPVALHNERHPITDQLKRANGNDFFLWIGYKIKAALELCKKNLESSNSNLQKTIFNNNKTLNMGLSWSFPIAQLEDISRGTILTMGKGYKVADEIAGKDLKDCFEKSFKTLNLNIKLTAIVNDTIASLVSHAFVSSETKAAVILGTGVNASALLPIDPTNKSNKALINTEISLLGGNEILPETRWDKIVDEEVDRPGFQPFETKVSGRYLGEIARLVINDLTRINDSNNQCEIPKGFKEKYGFDTAIMSKAEGYFLQGRMDQAVKLLNKSAKQSINNNNNKNVFTESDCLDICRLFQAISLRSAAFTAASLVALALNFEQEEDEDDDNNNCSTPTSDTSFSFSSSTTKKPISIAYSGTVIEKYPMYKERCQKFLDDFAYKAGFEKHQLILEPALDGTLYGPAIASAMNSC